MRYEIYTDGSMKSDGHDFTQGKGGWAYIIINNNEILHEDSKPCPNTTNQKMELTAAIEALEHAMTFLQPQDEVIVYSDSAYLINCYLQKWYINWMKNGWKNAKKEPVANKELWERLIPFFKDKSIHLEKVKGHASNYYNNLCDKNAQKAADGGN